MWLLRENREIVFKSLKEILSEISVLTKYNVKKDLKFNNQYDASQKALDAVD